MSKSIDEKVVEMRFDNRHFENNVRETMSTLDRFKQKLNLTGASKGLENINTAANKVNMNGMSSAIETIHSKFSALQVMGITALANITNSAVNAGKRIASALTIDPIMSGFSEYETQINAVQTILANTESKGTTLQQVNAALDELNTYADKTIYNFTEMTRNIGTFTAAGIDLKTSVSAIQGIANLAAVSGSTSQQASTAMYQLSQALASGTVKLMDWNSVVNAGMGGQVFQDALKETAKVHGVNVDKIIKKEGSFRESLKEGWITSEILTETLEKFTMAAEEGTEQWEAYKSSLMKKGYTANQAEDILKMANTATEAATKVKTFTQLFETLKESAQSGWTQSWEIIIGDFGEAKEFLTKISDTIGGMLGASADARNKLLSGGLSTGWKQLMSSGIADEAGYKETLQNIAKENGFEFEKLIKETEKNGGTFEDALKKALTDGNITSDMLTASVSKLSEKMQGMSAKEREAAGYTADHVKQIKELDEALKNGSISMDDFVKKMMRPSGRTNLIEALWNSFDGLMSVIKPIKEAFRDIFPAMTGEQLYEITEKIRDFTAKLKISEETANKIRNTFKGLFSAIDIGLNFFKNLAKGAIDIAKALFGFSDNVLNVTESIGNFITGLRDSVEESNIFGKVISGISGFITNIITSLKGFGGTALSSIGKTIKTIATAIKNTIVSIFSSLGDALESGSLEKVMDVFNKGLISLVLIKLKNFINFLGKGGTMLDTIKGVIGSVKGVFDSISGVLDGVRSSLETWQQNLKAGTLLKIAGAIGILALALIALSGIDREALKNSLSAITTLFFDLVIALKVLSTGSLTKGSKSIGMVIAMAISVSILAGALKKIASLEPGDLIKGVLAIAALCKIMAKVVNSLATNSGKAIKGALGIVAFGYAIKILASTCKDLSTLGWEELIRGLVGVGGLITAVTLFTKFAKTDGKMISTAIGIAILGGALKILESSVKNFAEMDTNALIQGGIAVGGLILVLGIFSRLAGNQKGLISAGACIAILAFSLKQIVPVFESLSALPVEGLIQSAGAIAATLAILIGAMKWMSHKNNFPLDTLENFMNAGALDMMVNMLDKIADALMKFAGIDPWDLAKGLGAVAISLVILIGATKIMKGSDEWPIVFAALALLTLAHAVKVLSTVGIWGIVGGLVAFAGVFTILGVATKLCKPLIPTMFKLAGVIAAFAGSFALLGVGIFALGAGLTTFITSLIAAFVGFKVIDWPEIWKGLVAIAGALVIMGVAAKLLAPLTKSILALSASMFMFGLAVAALGLGLSLIVSSIAGLAAVGEEGAKAAGISLKYMVTSILELIPEAVKQLGLGLIEFLKVIRDMMPVIGETLIATVQMLVDVLVTCAPDIAEGFLELLLTSMNLLVQYTPKIANLLFDFIIQMLEVLTTRIPELVTKFMNFLGALFQAIATALNGVDSDNLMKTIIGIGLMTIITHLLAGVVSAIPMALVGLAGLGVLVAELALIIAAIGGLAQIPGLSWLVEEGGNFLQKVGTAIGQFIGGIIGGFALGATSTLPEVGTNLSQFMMNLTPFIMGAKMIDPSVVEGVGTLVGVITSITGANIVESIASWLTGESSIAAFASELPILGTGLAAFAASLEGANVGVIAIAALAAKYLAEMTTYIPNAGGVASWFAGENSVASWAKELPVLGTGLMMFSTSVKGIDGNAIIAAAGAAKALAEMTNVIPNAGGVASWFAGENSVATWASQLPILGAGLMMFSTSVKGIDAEAIISATNAARSLAEMTAIIPNAGGVASWFAGENSVAKFSNELSMLGMGLLNFSISAKGIDVNAVTVATSAAKALSEMTATIPNSGGVVAWFTGDNSVSKFASELPVLGKGLKGFSDSLEGINILNISIASLAGKYLAEMTATTPKNTNHLKSFGDNIVKFGKKIKEFFNGITGVGYDNITSAMVKVENIVKFAKAVAGTNIDNLKTFGDSLKQFAKDGVKGFVKEFSGNDPKAEAKKAVEAMIQSGIDGANGKKQPVADKFKEIAKAAVDAMCTEELKTSANSAGKDLVQGFANGINNNKSLATDAGSSLGKAALNAAKAALDENSPSKEMYKVGDFAGIGFVNALYDNVSNAFDAGSKVGDYAKKGLSNAVSRITDVINSDMDTNPTIRPVLDLSDVESGVGYLSSMFNNGPSLAVATNLGAISQGMNSKVQNGTNNDVISAINKLSKNLGNAKGDTYNINGMTYDDGSNVTDAVKQLYRAVKMERRV